MKTIAAAALIDLMRSNMPHALFDVREIGEAEAGHILGATFLPRRMIEFRIADLVPVRTTTIVIYDEGGKRAERIAMWVRQALSKPVPVRKLNVGHHMPTGKASDTSDQRRVVIILVLEREDGTNVDEALRAAMALESVKAPIFEALLTRYSLSANKAFTWVE